MSRSSSPLRSEPHGSSCTSACARTAIFNWLYCAQAPRDGSCCGSRTPTIAALVPRRWSQAILDGHGLARPEARTKGPYFQSRARSTDTWRTRDRLLETGPRLPLTSATRRGRSACDSREGCEHPAAATFTYPRTCRSLPPKESRSRREHAGEPFAVRFEVPDGRVEWNDLVHGKTRRLDGRHQVEDFVILRSNGHAYLHAVGGVRRRRDEDHPRDPWRRPPLQHAQADPALRGAWVNGRARPSRTCR